LPIPTPTELQYRNLQNRREKGREPTKGGKLQTVDTLDSASTRSAGEGDPGCPEFDLEPQIHMMGDFNNEKFKVQHMIKR